eukprot:scaffold95239_cov17-Tisochrysis_lutea.AAC.1
MQGVKSKTWGDGDPCRERKEGEHNLSCTITGPALKTVCAQVGAHTSSSIQAPLVDVCCSVGAVMHMGTARRRKSD